MWTFMCNVRQRITNFIQNHKKLVIFTSLTSICGISIYYIYHRMLLEAEKFTLQMHHQLAEQQRLQKSLNTTKEEAKTTYQRFIPKLKSIIYEHINLEIIVQELKQLSKSTLLSTSTMKIKRHELWQNAKITSITRYFTTLNALVLWHLIIFAQIAILSKRTFEKEVHKDKEWKENPNKDVVVLLHRQQSQHEFLASGIEYFFEYGIQKLSTHVETIVRQNKQLESWKVSQKAAVQRQEMENLCQSLSNELLLSSKDLLQQELWRSFLIYPEKLPSHSEEVISLLNDYWDLLESELFYTALNDLLTSIYTEGIRDLIKVIYGEAQEERITIVEDHTDKKQYAPPLAKLIPVLQNEASKMFIHDGNIDAYGSRYAEIIRGSEAFRQYYEAIFYETWEEQEFADTSIV